MQRAILHAQRQHAHTRAAAVHQQVERKILHKELRVVLHRSTVQRVQHRMPRAVSRRSAAVRLPALAEV